MDKKSLRKIPMQPATSDIFKLGKVVKPNTVILSARQEEKMLVVTAYEEASLKKNIGKPHSMLFLDKESMEYISLVKEASKESYKWSGANLNHNYALGNYHRKPFIMDSPRSEKVLRKYLGFSETEQAEDGILDFQRQVAERNLQKKHKKETDEIDERLSVLKKVPVGLKKWAFKDALLPYIVYENIKTEKSKPTEISVTCTNCRGTRIIPKTKAFSHRAIVKCPVCGAKAEAICKSKVPSGRTSKSRNLAMLERISDREFCFRYFFAHDKLVLEGAIRETELFERGRDFVTITGSKTDYERFEMLYTKGEYRWWHSPQNGTRYRWSTLIVPSGLEKYAFESRMYPVSVKKAMEGSERFKYFPLYEQVKAQPDLFYEYSIECFIQAPDIIEKLIKVGLYGISGELLGKADIRVDETKKDLLSALKLNSRTELKLLKKFDCLQVLGYMQEAHRANYPKELTEEDIKLRIMAADLNEYALKRIHNAGATPHKVLKYMFKELNLGKVRTDIGRASLNLCGAFVHDYADYLDWLRELNVPLTSANLYPNNLKEVHDKVYADLCALRDKMKQKEIASRDRKIRAFAKKLMKKLLSSGFKENADGYLVSDKYQNLCVAIPFCEKALKQEGHSLGHCVGGYGKSLAENSTSIFFIRDISNPEQSFFTLEVKNDDIVQCRTAHNESYDNGKHEQIVSYAQFINKALAKKPKKRANAA